MAFDPYNPLLRSLLAKSPPAHPIPGTGPYKPPPVVDPGETDPAGALDVNRPGQVRPGYIDTIGLLGGLYPRGVGIQNHRIAPLHLALLHALLLGGHRGPKA